MQKFKNDRASFYTNFIDLALEMNMETVEREREDIMLEEKRDLPLRRVSWGAIFAGVVVVIALQLLFSVLGIGIGAGAVDPVADPDPMSGLGFGAGIWFVITALISLFVGGWVAARLAGLKRKTESTLHGLVTWGLATVLGFWMVTTAAGTLLGGAANILGQTAAIAGPQVADDQAMDMEELQRQAQQMFGGEQEQQAGQQQQTEDEMRAQAREFGDAAASGIAQTAIWLFFIMLLSAGAAAAGGYIGRREEEYPQGYRRRH